MSKATFICVFIFCLSFSFKAFSTIHIVRVSNVLNPDTSTNVFVGDTIRFVWESEGHSMMFTSVPNGVTAPYFSLNSTDSIYDYIVPVAGEYSYTCYPHGNFQGYFNAQGGLGIKHDNGKQLYIFPNPTIDKVHISATITYSDIEMVVFDVAGREIKREELGFNGKSELDFSEQSKGIYFLKAVRNKEVIFEERIIKL